MREGRPVGPGRRRPPHGPDRRHHGGRHRRTLGEGRDLLTRARGRGASAGDAILVESDTFAVQVRLKAIDKIKQARERRLGLRLFFGQRSAITATSDLSRDSLDRLLEETCAMAAATPEDPAAGLPEPSALADQIRDLDLYDGAAFDLSLEERIALARRAEEAALAADQRITNSEGGDFEASAARICYANSHGFLGEYRSSSHALSVVPVAAANGQMQRDYWYTAHRKLSGLEAPESVGRTAAARAVRRLGARKVPTQEVPVIFEPEIAASLLRTLAAAASGGAIYKKTSFLAGRLGEETSFLAGRLGEAVASQAVTVVDNGSLPGALGSRPFDAEGLPTRRTIVVEQGVLKSYLLDTYSARKLGLVSTGNAGREVGDAPVVAATNFLLLPGPHPPEVILRSLDRGLLVTELIGFGVNLVTGDYSRGAAGLWIEKGEVAYPVEEITIAGNLKEMLRQIEMVGSDLILRGRFAAPTLKIARMTVAGH
ncbi:MAG: TldD/PmbA family protein [candidate division NC10 bacterium]|nr:TldD/PmbA family protein [candidate division NC10 bacterium]